MIYGIDAKSFIPKRKNIGTEKKNINNPNNNIHDNNYFQPYYASNTYKALQYHQPGFYPSNYSYNIYNTQYNNQFQNYFNNNPYFIL